MFQPTLATFRGIHCFPEDGHDLPEHVATNIATVAVAQLVEALRYKPGGLRFDSRWCHWNVSLT